MQKPILFSLNWSVAVGKALVKRKISEPFSLCTCSWDEICMEIKSFSVHLNFCCPPRTFLTLLCPRAFPGLSNDNIGRNHMEGKCAVCMGTQEFNFLSGQSTLPLQNSFPFTAKSTEVHWEKNFSTLNKFCCLCFTWGNLWSSLKKLAK